MVFFSSRPAHLVRAEELAQSPPKGIPYSVALPGSEKPERSKVYRSFHAQDELLKTLDPNVWALRILHIQHLAMTTMEGNTNLWGIGSNRS